MFSSILMSTSIYAKERSVCTSLTSTSSLYEKEVRIIKFDLRPKRKFQKWKECLNSWIHSQTSMNIGKKMYRNYQHLFNPFWNYIEALKIINNIRYFFKMTAVHSTTRVGIESPWHHPSKYSSQMMKAMSVFFKIVGEIQEYVRLSSGMARSIDF